MEGFLAGGSREGTILLLHVRWRGKAWAEGMVVAVEGMVYFSE